VAVTNFLLLYALMRRHVSHMHTGLLVALLAKVLLAGVALAAVCWAGEHWLLSQWQVQATAPKALGLLVTIALAAAAFFAVAAWLRISEVTQVVALVGQRLGRMKPRS
jgi:putative peptidoglycan lipid II flippase